MMRQWLLCSPRKRARYPEMQATKGHRFEPITPGMQGKKPKNIESPFSRHTKLESSEINGESSNKTKARLLQVGERKTIGFISFEAEDKPMFLDCHGQFLITQILMLLLSMFQYRFRKNHSIVNAHQSGDARHIFSSHPTKYFC